MKCFSIVLLLVFVFFTKNTVAQSITYEIIEENFLDFNRINQQEYKSIISRPLGKLNYLHIDLLPSDIVKDSISFRFILWACPYYISLDFPSQKLLNQCRYSNNFFDMYIVNVKQNYYSNINERTKEGIYKKHIEFKRVGIVNDTTTLKLPYKDSFSFVFDFKKDSILINNNEISDFYPIYIKIKRK